MADWAGLDAEIEGVRLAKRNQRGDHIALARYVYDRASAYIGTDHDKTAEALIAASLEPAPTEGQEDERWCQHEGPTKEDFRAFLDWIGDWDRLRDSPQTILEWTWSRLRSRLSTGRPDGWVHAYSAKCFRQRVTDEMVVRRRQVGSCLPVFLGPQGRPDGERIEGFEPADEEELTKLALHCEKFAEGRNQPDDETPQELFAGVARVLNRYRDRIGNLIIGPQEKEQGE